MANIANEQPNGSGILGSGLAKFETYAGLFLVFLVLVKVVLGKIGYELELRGATLLFPYLALLLAACLIFAGAGLSRFPKNPVVWNIPVFLWFAVLALTVA